MNIRTIGITLVLFSSCGFWVLHATQETVIESEARQFGERAIARGFQCRTEIHRRSGQNFDILLDMDKDILYHIAIVTGRGEKTIHPANVTLINQDKKLIRIDAQNTIFGAELKLHPVTTGQKTLKVQFTGKTDYSLVLCANYASLYHTGEKDPTVSDHSHF
ncbi:MAG: hypothetical protein J0L53_13100 [Spirochaetes bacterium]|nr:hypothetical protein [Spirochaetota bacterium]